MEKFFYCFLKPFVYPSYQWIKPEINQGQSDCSHHAVTIIDDLKNAGDNHSRLEMEW